MRSGSIRHALGSLTVATAAIFPVLLLAAPASAASLSSSRATNAIRPLAPGIAPARGAGRKKQAVPAPAAPGLPTTSTGHGGLSSTDKLVIGGATLIAGGLLLRELTDF